VVGDEDQSIYKLARRRHPQYPRFRKGLPRRAHQSASSRTIAPPKRILEAAGAVVANKPRAQGQTLWTDSAAGEAITVYAGYDAEKRSSVHSDAIERMLAQSPGDRVAVLYRTNSQIPAD